MCRRETHQQQQGPFFLQRTHIVKPHPPSLPKRGVGMGVGWAYETLVTQGRPKQGQDTYSHLSEVAYSHHPIEDNAKSTWLDSKPGKKNAPRRWGPQPSYPSGSPAEVLCIWFVVKHIIYGNNCWTNEDGRHLSNHSSNKTAYAMIGLSRNISEPGQINQKRLSGSQIISYMHGCMTTLTPSAGEMGRK